MTRRQLQEQFPKGALARLSAFAKERNISFPRTKPLGIVVGYGVEGHWVYVSFGSYRQAYCYRFIEIEGSLGQLPNNPRQFIAWPCSPCGEHSRIMKNTKEKNYCFQCEYWKRGSSY